MDRSMKVMFGMMTLAICLMAFSMIGNQSQQVYAGEYVGGADRGSEPTIVWMGVSWDDSNNRTLYHRLWSDGLLQMRYVFHDFGGCTAYDSGNCGWFDVEPPTGGDGVACSADVNSDSVVDVTDLLAVMSSWYDDVVCEPTYECIDLNNLPSGMGG
jgi:hypothetical protein